MILQEGGYYVPALGENARAWLRGAEGRPYDPRPVRAVAEDGEHARGPSSTARTIGLR